jgi:hypothetical protein
VREMLVGEAKVKYEARSSGELNGNEEVRK